MVVGGQWGSEGKGLFAGYLAQQRKPDAVVCQFGPNAGHTWYEGDRPIVFKSLPVAAIAKSVKRVFLGPGSVINPLVLQKEIDELGPLLNDKKIYVHEAAAILMPGDAEKEMAEGGVTHIASTRQGTSEAMIRKIRRQTDYEAPRLLRHLPTVKVIPHNKYRNMLWSDDVVQVEGAQGMDLSINSGMEYPYTTSRDCTPAQVMADCGLHPYDLSSVYVCIRTYPIRVGNILGGNGLVLGKSGPHYSDQTELTWDIIGQPEELTTVTKRVRRVFSFSLLQTAKMLDELRPAGVFLNFANYLSENDVATMVRKIDEIAGEQIVRWTGHGPRASDIRVCAKVLKTPPFYKE
jgi:adenylosuccinate synthase